MLLRPQVIFFKVRAAMVISVVLLTPSAHALDPTVDECLSASEKGQLSRDEGRYRLARASLSTCARESCPAVVRRDCLQWLTDLDRLQPTVVFVVRDEHGDDVADVAVSMDGESIAARNDGRPLAVDAGQHLFTFVAPHHREQRQSLIVSAGEKNRVVPIRMELEADASKVDARPSSEARAASSSVPALPIVLGGVGVLALGSFAYFGLTARSDLHALEASPCASSRTCAEGDVRSIRTRLLLADVSLGVGVVALGAAAWVWLSRDRSSAPSITSALPIDVRPSLGGLSVQVRLGF